MITKKFAINVFKANGALCTIIIVLLYFLPNASKVNSLKLSFLHVAESIFMAKSLESNIIKTYYLPLNFHTVTD